MRIGIEARQHRHERVLVALGKRLHRGGANDGRWILKKVDKLILRGVDANVRGSQRGLGPQRGIRGRGAHDGQQGRACARIANLAERANRFDDRPALVRERASAGHPRQQHGHGGSIFDGAETARGKCARVRAIARRERQQCRQRARVLGAREGIRHGPPLRARLAVR